MIKTILFDFGGVFFASFSNPWKGNVRSATEVKRLKDPVTRILENNWEKITARVFGREELKQAILELNTYTDAEIEELLNSLTSINNYVLDLAKTLKNRGLILCSLNNERPLWTDFWRMYFSLDNIFNRYFVSCEIGHKKPNPEIYQHVLTQLNLQGKYCFFIDDKKENIEAAREFGITTHHFQDISARDLKTALQKLKIIK